MIPLTKDQRIEAMACYRRLYGTGLSLLEAVEKALSDHETQVETINSTVEETVNANLIEAERRGSSQRHLAALRQMGQRIVGCWGHLPITELAADMVREWLERKWFFAISSG